MPTLLENVSGWFGGLFGRSKGRQGTRTAAGRPGSGSRSTSRRSGSSEDSRLFIQALCELSPDFDRYHRVAGEEAGFTAMRDVYAALPQTGKPSRAGVARRFLVRKAEAARSSEDVALLERLSERQVIQVARRAGIPI